MVTDFQNQLKRFSARLRFALDARAYPSGLYERSKRLSLALQIDSSTAMNFLMGTKVPDYHILFKLCDELHRQPGFFFDELSTGDDIKDARLVKPLINGEGMVMRFTSEITAKWPSCLDIELWYITAKKEMFAGVMPGDNLITLTHKHNTPIIESSLYLFLTEDGSKLYKCKSMSKTRSVFISVKNSGNSTILPMLNGELESIPKDILHLGLVVAMLRSYATLPALESDDDNRRLKKRSDAQEL